MPLDAWRMLRNPEMYDDPDLEQWACKNRARWVFLGLDGKIHTYCWWHLFSRGFEASREEEERYSAWVAGYMKTHDTPPDWTDQEPDEPLSRH